MRETFNNLLRMVKRPGIEGLITFLEQNDFFSAPASTRHHGAQDRGLVEHSLAVYNRLTKLIETFNLKYDRESVIICGLLHDICKVNYYKKAFRNKKNDDNGQWERIPTFQIEDQLPIGHGEKSVIILQRYIQLTDEEIVAIRWHMGGFDEANSNYGGSQCISTAMQKYPLLVALHMADLAAAYFDAK